MSFNSELSELYQEVILDHSKRPRNTGTLEHPTHKAAGNNPLCGDQLVIYLEIEGDRIKDVRYSGVGCAISTASASMMSEAIKGKTLQEAKQLFGGFHDMLVEQGDVEAMGKLGALAGTREFPMRVKCATLAWHTMLAALQNQPDTVSTEDDAQTS